MTTLTLKATVVEDNSGIQSQLPLVFTEQGEVQTVTDYLLYLEANDISQSVINRTVRAIRLIIDYMEANKDLFDEPRQLFQTFVKRLYTGTVGEDGLDPSGLYWLPTSTENTNSLIIRLNAFHDWLADGHDGITHMNPIGRASTHDQRLKYAAWFKRNQYNFLGHIKSHAKNQAVKNARAIKGRQPLSKDTGVVKAFPEKHFNALFQQGFGNRKDKAASLRDQLILLLMHGGGLRESEALTLWVTDVLEHPQDPESALVRVYHEGQGRAPYDWKGRKGTHSREAYLKEKYARVPRYRMKGTQHLGWKGKIVENDDNYLQVQWFPADYGKLFMVLWRDYSRFRASVDTNHPYAFISFQTRYLGNPYTLGAFNENYIIAINRIGLEPNKSLGISPHGHRHNYGKRLANSGIHERVIQKCLHHSSPTSQLVYTEPTQTEVSRALTDATRQLESGEKPEQSFDWKELLKHGFDDIDPDGLYSGHHPKLRYRI